jgi:hypothetical protein
MAVPIGEDGGSCGYLHDLVVDRLARRLPDRSFLLGGAVADLVLDVVELLEGRQWQ